MSKYDLKELERLEKAATKGPWGWGVCRSACLHECGITSDAGDVFCNCGRGSGEPTDDDAALIVAARNALPHLLADLTAANAEVERLKGRDWQDALDDLADWQDRTFGTAQGPIGALNHLSQEVEEAKADPTDIIEYVDCLMLIMAASRRAGFTFDQLHAAFLRKLEINKQRRWAAVKPGEPCRHVDEAALAAKGAGHLPPEEIEARASADRERRSREDGSDNCDCKACDGEGFMGHDGETCACIRNGCRKKHGRDKYLPRGASK
jgi:hypothetical protein